MTKKEVMAQKKNSENDFQKELSINKYKLDEECISHASRYAYYAEAQALAKSNVSKAKDNLELVMAERNMEIREQLSSGEKKVTEAMVNATIAKDEKVLEAKSELRDAEEVYSRLTVAVQAFDVKRSELDNLVKLYCAGYFSTVKSDGSSRKNINEQTSGDIRKNLNKE